MLGICCSLKPFKTNFFEKLETMDFKNVYEDTNYLFKNDHLIMFE